MNAKAELIPAEMSQMAARAITPLDMLNQAVSSGANIDVLSKLMDLHERWERAQSRRDFDEAIAAAKAELSPVTRNKAGHNNKRYADFAAYANAADAVLSKFGLTYRFRAAQDDRISVTCILSHKSGHSEENTLSGPADTSGSKNAIQAIGSTLTYLQRYTLAQALGLAATDDDDGRASGTGDNEPITEAQIGALRRLIMDTDSDLPRFLEAMKVERLEDLTASGFAEAEKKLRVKAARKSEKADG